MLVIGSAIVLGTMVGLGADHLRDHFNTEGTPGDVVSKLDGLTNDPSDVRHVWNNDTTNAIGEAIDDAKGWFDDKTDWFND